MWCDISFFEILPLSISQSGYETSYHAMQGFGYISNIPPCDAVCGFDAICNDAIHQIDLWSS